MTSDEAIRAVEEAAAMYTLPDFEHEHTAPELQAAVARAVTRGMPIRDVAAAAHMTALEVLDAVDDRQLVARGLALEARTVAQAED